MASSLMRQRARYGVAVLASGAAFLLRRVLTAYIGPGLPTYLLFYPAVMLTATVCGLGPGLLATAASGLLAAYFILPPEGFAVGSPSDALGLGIFALMGFGMSLVAEGYHRARDRAARYATELAVQTAEARAAAAAEQAIRAREQALQASEQRYRSLVDLAPDAVLVHQDERIVYANAAALRLYGAENVEQLRGRAILDLVHPEDRAMVQARIHLVLTGEMAPLRELRHHRLDGTELPVETMAALIDWQGHSAVQVIVRDVTERKRSEDALATYTRQLESVRAITEEITRELDLPRVLDLTIQRAVGLLGGISGDIYLWADDQERLVPAAWVNEGEWIQGVRLRLGEQLAGQVAGQRTGIIVNDYQTRPDANPVLRAAGRVAAALMEPLLCRDRLVGVITVDRDAPARPFTPADSHLLRLFATQAAIAIENARLYAAAQRELVERARAEETLRRYHLLSEQARDIVLFVRRPDGQILEANPAAAAAYGYSLEALQRLRIHALRAPECRPLTAQQLAQADTDAGILFETVHCRKDESTFPVEVSSRGTNLGGERVLLSIVRDITERKRTEAALQQAKEELERRVEERTRDLTAALTRQAAQAEQLRTLTGELTLAEERERHRLGLLLHDGLQQLLVSARLRVYLLGRTQEAELTEGCREITALLDEAVRSTRALSAEISPPILHTAGFVPALQWLARWMADTHKLTVTVQADPGIRIEADAARVLLFQAVRELLFNVVKHAGVNQARVGVATQASGVQIQVTDQGKGFQPDQRGAAGVSGLGLPSIRQRLEYLGGTLEIASAPGQGSRFTLTVPLPASS